MANDTSNSEPRDTIVDTLKPYAEDELDSAMRELEAIEAAERDMAVLRRYGLTKAFDRIFALGALALALLVPSVAQAEEPAKPKRPTMCLSGQPVGGKDFAGYICLDGKRPRVFTRYIVVQFVDSEGRPASYVLGWTAPVKRTSKGGFVAEGTPVIPAGGMKL